MASPLGFIIRLFNANPALRALRPYAVASFVVHGGLLGYLATVEAPPPPKRSEVIELAMIQPPPPPPPPPLEEPPKVEPPKPVRKPPPVKVAQPEIPPPEPEPETEVEPPPPNEPPPPEAPKVVPIVVGISMSSTTTAGTFAAPVGNTVYGKTADKAADPNSVQKYAGPKYMPIYQVDRSPTVKTEVRIDYPPEAKRASIEGTVTLKITVDENGKVVRAVVVNGPGYGLNEAAREAVLKFAFNPAVKNGEPVATEMTYAYTFLLD